MEFCESVPASYPRLWGADGDGRRVWGQREVPGGHRVHHATVGDKPMSTTPAVGDKPMSTTPPWGTSRFPLCL